MSEPAIAKVDFDTTGSVAVDDRDELCEFLSSHHGGRLRLLGTGSAQHAVPAPDAPVALICLAGMDRIVRIEPEDLTCSVEPGLARAVLEQELRQQGLCLPCPGDGTLGGLFALGEYGPLAPGALSARSLLLGLEGVLAEGLAFKAGARVVKSVAGFDLQKLFVGSRGRLFAATLLHLKLRQLPRYRCTFVGAALDRPRAVEMFRELRLRAHPPTALVLTRGVDGAHGITGTYEGVREVVEPVLQELGLQRDVISDRELDEMLQLPSTVPEREVVRGFVRPSRIEKLLDLEPRDTALWVTGTGQFQTELAPTQTDGFLAKLAEITGYAEIRVAARDRRGIGTPRDSGAVGIEAELARNLDPGGVLA